MQSQRARTENQIITSNQSLAAVQTLLKAGLGCITFLRDLLPNENFTEAHFTTWEDSPQSSQATPSNTSSQNRNVNGFKIMSMTRGYSDEADRILNYLEYGIFDALEKQYLRSFIFAIYLDSNQPNNVVEAYTFNFHYYKIPGTGTVIPIMSLGDDAQSTSLGRNPKNKDDPVSDALKNGRAPTLRDVKRSVKNLLKKLISAMSQMDLLPKRRFATFKLFYNDSVPAEYEPPHFETGDVEKDKWYFMTHDLDEMPDTWNVGRINTGHHAVNLTVTSIATYLPSSYTPHDNAVFAGTTPHPVAPLVLTPMEEASLRARQADEQCNDAENRNVVWSVEDAVDLTDLDADGDDDPEYTGSNISEYGRSSLGIPTMVPVGFRNDMGEIQSLSVATGGDLETVFSGVSETVPTSLHELNAKPPIDPEIEQTQSMSGSQDDPTTTPGLARTSSTLACTRNNSPISDLVSPTQSRHSPSLTDVEVRMLEGLSLEHEPRGTPDIEMLNMETQLPEPVECAQPFSKNPPSAGDASLETPREVETDVIDNGLECDCGVLMEDEQCFCEGGCGRWYHIWCMGYHSTADDRMPLKFICFDCRLRADVSWDLIKVDLYPKMISKFRDLALFRRAIKVVETDNPGTVAEFAKMIGGDNGLARHLFKRLELEGFIAEQTIILDGFGLSGAQTRSAKEKGKIKAKQQKVRKNVQKPRYSFNRSSRETTKYADYFNPNYEVESRLLGISALATFKTNHPINPTHVTTPDSQTQEETQYRKELKRPLADSEGSRPTKKIKISITRGVDLAE